MTTAGTGAGPLRVGILGAARIAELAIVKPAHATGTRLVTVAARDRRRGHRRADRPVLPRRGPSPATPHDHDPRGPKELTAMTEIGLPL